MVTEQTVRKVGITVLLWILLSILSYLVISILVFVVIDILYLTSLALAKRELFESSTYFIIQISFAIYNAENSWSGFIIKVSSSLIFGGIDTYFIKRRIA
jgi:hypothetical protein